MRILLIYPGHSHSTIDVAAGYDLALRTLGCKVRAFCYHQQIAFYSEAIRHFMRINKRFQPALPQEAALLLASEQAALQAVDFVPDVALVVNGFALHRRAYDLLARLGIPTALLLTESPYLDDEQARIIEQGHVALAFTNDRSSVQPLGRAGAPVVYLPHSFDPTRHRPQAVADEERSDVFFFGTLWPERKRLLWPLRRWLKMHHPQARVDIGGAAMLGRGTSRLIDNDELARRYSGAAICLNHHRTISSAVDGKEQHVSGAWSLGPRAFEIAACGAFQLSDERPELREVFGTSVPTYSDARSLRELASFYLTHPDERQRLAEESMRRVQQCSFERRAAEIVLPELKRLPA